MTVSGHKLHAPKGVGALFIKSGIKLPPLLLGGGQESGRRSGTEALPLIGAFAEAVREGKESGIVDNERISRLRATASDRLKAEIPGIIIIGGGAPHILCVSIPGYKSEVLMNFLESRGIYVSTGSACKRGKRSHVLTAIGLGTEIIDGALRISLSRFTTGDEISALCGALAESRSAVLPVLGRL
jgi:cysteine desulfurase